MELLDGIPGWLVEFGYNYIETNDFDKAIEGVLVKAEKFLEGELRELEKRSRRYLLILKAIAMGFDRWELVTYPAPKGRSFPRSTRLYGKWLHTGVQGWVTTAPSHRTRYPMG